MLLRNPKRVHRIWRGELRGSEARGSWGVYTWKWKWKWCSLLRKYLLSLTLDWITGWWDRTCASWKLNEVLIDRINITGLKLWKQKNFNSFADFLKINFLWCVIWGWENYFTIYNGLLKIYQENPVLFIRITISVARRNYSFE